MTNPAEEFFEIIDDATGLVIGRALRKVCHGDPSLIHRSVHVAVYHPDGRILLQKRSMAKDIQPGKWDTAVGGHLNPGEDYETAARREMNEELGLPSDLPLTHLFDLKVRNSIESENIMVFKTVSEGQFRIQKSELDEVRFWTVEELKAKVNSKSPEFTPMVIEELKKIFALGGD